MLSLQNIYSKTIYVGQGEAHSNIQTAAFVATPGDTILVREGNYPGGMYIENLQGTADNPIYIIADVLHTPVISGGTNAIQFTDARYLVIKGIIFEQQTGNGLNVDDGGTYDSPTTNLTFAQCIFRDMNASGNNDLLKLSGLDKFEIIDCDFVNGAGGGSGVDMVGCHHGIIKNCRFINMGSNAIQAKGGTQYIEISSNYFENCGQRTLNLGGSTGLAFFRPIDAKFEAADLQVYSNIFIGSNSPINFVGCQRVDVINNTIINPIRWVLRILQETVDENRFVPCGENKFMNNLIYFGNISTEVNIGPNTAPHTFEFTSNFWYNHQNSNWSGPALPVTDLTQVIGKNPTFENFSSGDFRLMVGSPAIGFIDYNGKPDVDYNNVRYASPRSAGAFETMTTSIRNSSRMITAIYPNPSNDILYFELENTDELTSHNIVLKIFDNLGSEVFSKYYLANDSRMVIDVSNLSRGFYVIKIGESYEKFLKL